MAGAMKCGSWDDPIGEERTGEEGEEEPASNDGEEGPAAAAGAAAGAAAEGDEVGGRVDSGSRVGPLASKWPTSLTDVTSVWDNGTSPPWQRRCTAGQ